VPPWLRAKVRTPPFFLQGPIWQANYTNRRVSIHRYPGFSDLSGTWSFSISDPAVAWGGRLAAAPPATREPPPKFKACCIRLCRPPGRYPRTPPCRRWASGVRRAPTPRAIGPGKKNTGVELVFLRLSHRPPLPGPGAVSPPRSIKDKCCLFSPLTSVTPYSLEVYDRFYARNFAI
jgi:hypothetical protein